MEGFACLTPSGRRCHWKGHEPFQGVARAFQVKGKIASVDVLPTVLLISAIVGYAITSKLDRQPSVYRQGRRRRGESRTGCHVTNFVRA